MRESLHLLTGHELGLERLTYLAAGAVFTWALLEIYRPRYVCDCSAPPPPVFPVETEEPAEVE